MTVEVRPTEKSRKVTKKVKPMSNEEFDQLIKNIKRPLKTSEGGQNHNINKLHNNNPKPSLRANYMYGNAPLLKIQRNNFVLNHMFDGTT